MEFAELQRAMQQNKASTQKLAGYDEELARANVLRGGPGAQLDDYGRVAPLQVIADLIGNSQGRAQARDLKPLMEATRTEINDSQLVADGYQLKQTMDANERKKLIEQSNLNKADQVMEFDKNQETRDAENHRSDKNSVSGGATFSNGVKGEDINVVYNSQGYPQWLKDDGTLAPIPSGYVEATPKLNRGKSYTLPNKLLLSKMVSSAYETSEAARDFDDSYAQPTNLPTGFADRVAKAMSRNDIMSLVDKDTDVRVKEAAQWWANWRMLYTLPQRNETFGATLTKREQASWDEAEHVTPGMNAKEIQKRVDTLTRIANDAMLRLANGERNGLPDTVTFWEEQMRDRYLLGEDGRWVQKPDHRVKEREEKVAAAAAKKEATELKNAETPVSFADPVLTAYYDGIAEEDKQAIMALNPENRTAVFKAYKASKDKQDLDRRNAENEATFNANKSKYGKPGQTSFQPEVADEPKVMLERSLNRARR